MHSLFEERGIDVEVTWSEKEGRVEATCPDIEGWEFPCRSWFVTEKHYRTGDVGALLGIQADLLEERLNAD